MLGRLDGNIEIGTKINEDGFDKGISSVDGKALTGGKRIAASLNAGVSKAFDGLRSFGAKAGAAVAGVMTKLLIAGAIVAALGVLFIGLGAQIFKAMSNAEGFQKVTEGINLAFANLKNAALSAFVPLVTMLEPTLIRIIGWLTEMVNRVGMFFAALSGSKTYSVYVANAMGSAASSGGAWADDMERGEEALNGSLASFDKLNVLQQPQKKAPGTPGGGGGGGSAPSGSWVEMPINVGTLAFMDKARQFFEDIKNKGWQAAVDGLFNSIYGKSRPKEKSWVWRAAEAFAWFADEVDKRITGVGNSVENFKKNVDEWGLGEAIAWELNPENWFVKTDDLPKWLETDYIQVIGNAFKKLFGVDLPNEAQSGSKQVQDEYSLMPTWFEKNVYGPIKRMFRDLFGDAKSGAKDGSVSIRLSWGDLASWFDQKVWQPIKDKADIVWDYVRSGASNLGTNIAEAIVGAVNAVIRTINSLISDVESAINELINLLNYLPAVSIPSISIPAIPLMQYVGKVKYGGKGATGMVIPPGDPFMAIYGDQRSGTNVEAPLATIEEAVENVLRRTGSMNQQPNIIHNVLKLDSGVLYEANERESRRIGNSMITRRVSA